MEVNLRPETDQFVHDQVHAGIYTNINEVIEHALDLLKQRELNEAERAAKLERLRKDIQVGIDQADRGEFVEWNTEEFLAQARRRLNEKKK